MRKTQKTIAVLSSALCLFLTMNCSNKTEQNSSAASYIGPSDMKIENGVMTPEVLLSMGRLSDPQLSPDGQTILYGVSYTSIAENRSCRNLFICNVDGTGKVQLTQDGKSISNARWSNDGKTIYFIQGGQIWSAPFNAGKLGTRTKLSEVPSGISEFKLSPDQTKVLFISTIKNEKVKEATDIDASFDKASAYVTEDLMYRHWDHWVTETPRTYCAAFGKGTITPENSTDLLGNEPYELPTEPFGGAEQLDWSSDSRYIAYSCRKHMGKEYAFSTNCGIYLFDTNTGKTITVKGDGGYDTDPVWSPDGSYLAWISMPRDGYEADAQRILACATDLSGAEIKISEICELAAGLDRDKSGLLWTPNSKAVVFAALDNGTEKIYCTGLEGGVRQITKDDEPYDFSSPFAMSVENGTTTLYASNACLNRPTELIRLTVGNEGYAEWTEITNENEHLLSQMDAPTSESVWLETVDHKQMQCWVLYPPKFDATKQYPAVEIVLGGPQGTNSQGWSYRWCYRLMAQQGYIVIMPNRRGTTAFGQEWKEQISGDYPGLNMQDYLTAGRYIKCQPYVCKLACVGASYGGYSAYMLEGLHGDLYDCFVAHAGIFNEEQMWYTTEEMWFANWDNGGLTEFAYAPGQQGPSGDGITFGGLQQAGAPYAKTPKAQRHYSLQPINMVTKWHTPILCIHGMMDYRIPYEQGMAAFNAAQMMGVPSRLVVF
ncbi:MAG: prolyl oligopeptidase family serine peptidase, partial [Bacteroidales bacterium]|nr:prolyl oligopeptidase family serine peptidase [Bacteroidales bacterium]